MNVEELDSHRFRMGTNSTEPGQTNLSHLYRQPAKMAEN